MNAGEQLFEVHEQRIQNLEEGQRNVAVQLAHTVTQLEHVAQAIDDGTARLTDKIETCISSLGEKVELNAGQISVLSDIIRHNTGRLERLEALENGRVRSRANFRKLIMPLFLASGGVIATKIGELLWTLVIHHG